MDAAIVVGVDRCWLDVVVVVVVVVVVKVDYCNLRKIDVIEK